MTEKELYNRTVALAKEANTLIDAALQMGPTIELCIFVGKLGAVLDILMVLEDAGVPVHEPDEEAHPLAKDN